MSVFSTQIDYYQSWISEYRAHFTNKNLLVIAGGPHSSGNPLSMLISGADIACIGEGELTIRDCVEAFLGSNDYNLIRGIAYLDLKRKLIRTPKPPQINLDEFPPFSINLKLF